MDEHDLMPVFMEIHAGNPREGPGSRASTTRAFQLLTELPSRPRILDVGCGPGRQTVGANLAVIEACGYRLNGHFTLPASD